MEHVATITSADLATLLRVPNVPNDEVEPYDTAASPMQPTSAVMQMRAAHNISPESVVQRARMTEVVPQLRNTTVLGESCTVKLPGGRECKAVPGRVDSVLNFFNAKYAPVGHDPDPILYEPVQKTFLQE